MNKQVSTTPWRTYGLITLGWISLGIIFGASVLSSGGMAGTIFLAIVFSVVISTITPATHIILLQSIYKRRGTISTFHIIVMAIVSIVIVMMMCVAMILTGMFDFT